MHTQIHALGYNLVAMEPQAENRHGFHAEGDLVWERLEDGQPFMEGVEHDKLLHNFGRVAAHAPNGPQDRGEQVA